VNVWLSEEDLEFLRDLASEREQSVSALLRRAIAGWRRDRVAAGGQAARADLPHQRHAARPEQ
jgi:hypothetical protein